MTKESTYSVARIDSLRAPLPTVATERDCDFQLSDARWQLVFRDGRRGVSGGLLNSQLTVERTRGRTCRVSVVDDTEGGFTGTLVVRARGATVRRDLDDRLGSLDRAGTVVEEVASGAWWKDARVFDGLGWSQRCSFAGVHYRAGWWGTGRLRPSMLAKVLDFGPRGIVLRGWRTRLVIPWDAVGSLTTHAGEAWRYDEVVEHQSSPLGTTLVVRSLAGQDAVFYTPLLSATEAGQLIRPFAAHLTDGGNIAE